ncbi:hypothetical protein NQ176_g4062 [Zarea fungicola]|uniref:Uncharacterized protein n=1 Tax=Zarea fungicola TaxID=93591 RepID=A0ACC1NI15_9HYPO|nr:hypothetical protein NQ176_g4062 [Lecanicillium fungicola]
MHWKTVTYALLVSVMPTVHAAVKMGCWSERGNKFHHHCVTGYTSLLQSLSRADREDWIDVPNRKVTDSFESCAVDLTSDGRSLKPRTLLVVYNQLASRCQNGWFYFDNGWMGGGVHGHAGWKRDVENSTAAGFFDIESTKDSVVQWELPDSIESFPLPEASPEESGVERSNDTQHDVELGTRALTFGQLIRTEHFRHRVIRIFRGTGVQLAGQHPISHQIQAASIFVIANMFDRGATGFYGGRLRDGIAQPDGSTVDALAMVAQLNNGVFASWLQLYNTVSGSVQEGVGDFGLLMARGLDDMRNNGFLAGVYHLYDQFDNLIVSFIINGVTGTVAPFPSS